MVAIPIYALKIKVIVADCLDYKDLTTMDKLPDNLFTIVSLTFSSVKVLKLLYTGRMDPRRPRRWDIVYWWVVEVIIMRGIFGVHKIAPVLGS